MSRQCYPFVRGPDRACCAHRPPRVRLAGMNEQIINGLVGLRAAVGAGAWIAPRLSGRLFGLDVAANPQAPYLGRLFGVRDVALAVGTSSSSGSERAQWLRLGVACD